MKGCKQRQKSFLTWKIVAVLCVEKQKQTKTTITTEEKKKERKLMLRFLTDRTV